MPPSLALQIFQYLLPSLEADRLGEWLRAQGLLVYVRSGSELRPLTQGLEISDKTAVTQLSGFATFLGWVLYTGENDVCAELASREKDAEDTKHTRNGRSLSKLNP